MLVYPALSCSSNLPPQGSLRARPPFSKSCAIFVGNLLISFVNLQSFLDIEKFWSILRSVFFRPIGFWWRPCLCWKKPLLCELYLNMFPLSSWFLLLPLSFLPLWLPQPTKQFPQLPKLSGRPPNSLCAPVGFPVDQSKRLPPTSANQRAGGDGTGQSETGMPLTNSNCCYLAQIGLVLAVNGCFHIHTGICLIAAPSHYQPRGGPRLFMAGSKGNFSDGQF